MIYRRKADLSELRKNQKNELLNLYAVFTNLNTPVKKVKYLSKNYVYWEDNTTNCYPSTAAGYILVDSAIEAWQIFKQMYDDKVQSIELQYVSDMKMLDNSKNILVICSEETPEYFF